MNEADEKRRELWAALGEVHDPETGLNIVDLGLVYGLEADPFTRQVYVKLTLTTRACPMGEAIQEGVRRRLSRVPGVPGVTVELVWDPPWTPERISDEGRKQLGW
jgi:metal-sulfur cluster biosynthetic enzyme